MPMRHLWALSAAAWLSLAASVDAGDWPMLGRDNTHNAVSPEKGPPIRWQIEERDGGVLVRPGWNYLWEAPLGRIASGSPTVADGLIWIGTNNERPRDPKVKGDGAVLMCFRASDGHFLWQYVSPRLKDEHLDYPHSGLNCSPLVEGGRLYFTTNRAEVLCFDIGPLKSGKGTPTLLWKVDMMKELGVSPVGLAMSVGFFCSVGASYRDRLFVITGNGVDEERLKVVAPEAPSLICIDRNSGKVLWKDSSPGKSILFSQWSSPLVVEIKGRGQVIAAQGDGWVRSFDALTGKLIWQFDTNPKNAVRGRNRQQMTRYSLIATPVYAEGRVYIANGESPADFGPGPGRLYCIDPTREGDVSPELPAGPGKGKPNPNSAAVWCFEGKEKKLTESMGLTMSTVAVHDGLVIAPTLDGYVHCLDAKSGKRYWTHDARTNIYSSPLIVDGMVYVGDEDGNVSVLALSKEKKLLAVNEVESGVSASPVFANGVLYVPSESSLYAFQAKDRGDRPPGHWPQWRGYDRTNVSVETGLLKRWPKDGPPLAWKVEGLGEGVGSVAVVGGWVFTLGYRDDHERLTALQEETGKPIWSVTIGPAIKENPVMRWMSQRTPTVDENRLYAVTARGVLVCLRTADGKEIWRRDYVKDFDGQRGTWGFADRPLVDGDTLICVPGGKTATIVALNKKTGETLWKCPIAEGDSPEYGATVVSTGGGVRQYIAVLRGGLTSVAAKDGKLLWRYDKVCRSTGNCYSPMPSGNDVFCAGGYGKGYALLELSATTDGVAVKEQYSQRKSLANWHETTIRNGDHVFAGTDAAFFCLDVATGKVLWEERGEVRGRVSVTCADEHLYLRAQDGRMVLIEASKEKYILKGTFKVPDAQPKAGSTAPVVASGRLYLRDDDRLFVYDVKEGATPRPPGSEAVPAPDRLAPPGNEREPGAVYVPTPQDIVEKMLELASVKKEDIVYDLGCGDGRIVVTAAKKYGCRAAGYDIDMECIKMSRENVRKADVGKLVTIERKDLFTLDLAGADVIALYLLPRMNERLLPQLEKLKPGSRIVCHANAIPGVRPQKVVSVVSKDDDLPHKVYLYVTPLMKEGKEK
jgi:outer membrane protein assembly factor BamB/SAM-dependent methyltransferase